MREMNNSREQLNFALFLQLLAHENKSPVEWNTSSLPKLKRIIIIIICSFVSFSLFLSHSGDTLSSETQSSGALFAHTHVCCGRSVIKFQSLRIFKERKVERQTERESDFSLAFFICQEAAAANLCAALRSITRSTYSRTGCESR